MTRKSEVLFVDPRVDDLEHVLGATRPEVEAVLLDGKRPPACQIADALADRRGLAAVHIMAHGSPGRVSFAAGDWTAVTVTDDSGELSAIGRALAADGDLRLWSCDTAYGQVGAVFLGALADAACADVAAATDRVGAADKGGAWVLSARAAAPSPQPPLTREGIEAFGGVLVAKVFNGSSGTYTWSTSGTFWTPNGVPAFGDTVTIGTRSGLRTINLDA